MSNFFLVVSGIILLDINCWLILNFFEKTNDLTFNFNFRYFCFSINYLTLTWFKNCLKILIKLTHNKVNVPH